MMLGVNHVLEDLRSDCYGSAVLPAKMCTRLEGDCLAVMKLAGQW